MSLRRAAAAKRGPRGPGSRARRERARPCHARSAPQRRTGGALRAGVRAARSASRAAWGDPVARAARGEDLRLERCRREQRGRGAHPCAAPQARRRLDPQRPRRGLDGAPLRIARMRAHSIRRELLAWLLGGLLVALAAAAVGTYLRAREEANALFDYQLKEMAASLTGAPFSAAPGLPGGAGGDGALVVQIWDRNGVQLYLSQPQRELPQYAQLGFTTIRTDEGAWRVFSTFDGSQVVQVAQPMSARRELATSMA